MLFNFMTISVGDLIQIIVDAVTGFVTGLASALVETATGLLFTSSGTGESATTTVSVLGVIIFAGVGLAIAYWMIDKVLGFIKLGKNK